MAGIVALATAGYVLAAAAGMAGTYQTTLNGLPATLTLEADGDAYSGVLSSADYEYIIECELDSNDELDDRDDALGNFAGDVEAGAPCTGLLYDPGTQASTYVEIGYAEGAEAAGYLDLFLNGDARPPTRLTLSVVGGTDLDSGADPESHDLSGGIVDANTADRDARLVGRWIGSGAYSSGDLSAAWQNEMAIHPDGSMQLSDTSMSGGGDLGAFDSAGDDRVGAYWRTQDSTLWVRVPSLGGDQWLPLGTYTQRGDSLLIVYGDGTRMLFQRAP